MTAPKRIQLRRTKGWRLPEGAIVVARPSKWGNPFRLRTPYGLVREPGALTSQPWEYEGRISAAGARHDYHHPDGRITICHVRYGTPSELVELYRRELVGDRDPSLRMTSSRRMVKPTIGDARRELAGHDLACWCPAAQPCHADVLLQLANDTEEPAP
jgi:hypothetical protein